MAKKKVYFYNFTLHKAGKKVDKSSTKLIFKDTIDSHMKKDALAIDKSKERITMDEILFFDNSLFSRIGREQDITSLAFRDNTRASSEVLPPNAQNWVDKLTYVLMDFDLGVMAIVNNQSAPNAYNLCNLFEIYNDQYVMDIDDIPNTKYYEALFKDGSTISKIKYKIKIPNVGALQDIKGMSTRQFNNIKDMDADFVEIIISAGPRKFMSFDNKAISEFLIEASKEADEYEKLEVEGTAPNSNKHTFDLKEEFFSFDIDVSTNKTVDKKKVNKTKDELVLEYRSKLKGAISSNRKFLEKFNKE